MATAGDLGKKAKKLQMVGGILDIFKLDPLVGATVARVNKVCFFFICNVVVIVSRLHMIFIPHKK